MTRIRLPIIGGFIVALSIVASALALSPQAAYADGGAVGGSGAGGGCSGSGCSTGPYTTNGYGWYSFDSSGAGPGDFKSGNWGTVSAQCRNTGNDAVIAFIVLRGSGGAGSARVYDYEAGDYGTYYRYLGNSGFPWLDYGTANGLFNQIDPSIRSGYTFGDNVAWFCYSYQNHWRVDASSYIKKASSATLNEDKDWTAGNITAAPNDVLYFKHELINRDAAVDETINWALKGSGFPSTFTIKNTGSITGSSNIGANQTFARLGQYPSSLNPVPNKASTVYTVTQDDVDKNLCENLQWTPGVWDGSGTGNSPNRCAFIPYNYCIINVSTDCTTGPPSCNPTAPGCSNTQPPACDPATANCSPCTITPTSASCTINCPASECITKTRNLYWQLTGFIVPPGSNVPSGGNDKKTPEVHYGFGATKIQSGTQSFEAGISTINITQPTIDIYADYAPGTKVCYGISMTNYSSDVSATDWSHSEPSCTIISKQPKVQVLGGDLLVGRPFSVIGGTATPAGVTTGTSIKTISGTRKTFGSWVEYGIFATGNVSGTGSGSAFAGPGMDNPPKCSYNKLTFVNATTSNPKTSCSDSTAIGHYGTSQNIPNIAANFPVTQGITPVFNDSEAKPQGIYNSNNHDNPVVYDPITIGAKTIEKGQWVVINAPNADVTINGDITYTNEALGSIYDIPQFVIIAKNIYINPGVQRIDAWLIAQGTKTADTGLIDTCRISADFATPLDITTCDKKLQVNGPVMAQKIWLRRTAGSGTGNTSGDPAEVFNLRPDAYLWTLARASSTGRAQTTYTQELPPRF